MYRCVPDFEMDDDYSLPSSSGAAGLRKSSLPEDEIMELLWQNGQVVIQSQNQRSMRRSPTSKYNDGAFPTDQSANREIRPSQEEQESDAQQHQHLFMQEDEMASWLHYPLVDDDSALDHNFCADLLIYATPNQSNSITNPNTNPAVRTNGVTEVRQKVTGGVATSRPPIPPGRRMDLADSNIVDNFVHFSRPKGKLDAGLDRTRPPSMALVRESTVVDSNETPGMGLESWTRSAAEASEFGNRGCCPTMSCDAAAGTSSAGAGGKEMMSCEITLTSSSGCSSGSAEPARKPSAGYDRKRKGREAEDADCHFEDVEFESAAAKKQVHGSTSTKRSRAAEVHNLSERRRRDRINEKMKALQELIPRCNKSDKASMLDEAIEYLKSLQLQVQMMSMGCGMVPMMFPGVQQYMPAMGMGIGMGMGMGMEMGINRSMIPFPNMLAGSVLQTSAAAAHLGPRFPIPAFHMPPVTPTDPSRIQATNRPEQMLHPIGIQHTSQPQFPNFLDPYQQYVATHQLQLPLPKNQALAQPSTINGPEIPDNHQSGT